MRLRKTEKARTELRERAGGLGANERRVLILCDGRRGLDELTRLLGSGVLASLERLRMEGYLEIAAAGPSLADRMRSASRELLGAALPAGPATAAPTPPASRTPTAVAADGGPARASRRSLAASKMYMLDLLQLQRSSEAAALRVAIQTAADDTRLVEQLLQALRYLQDQAAPSYAARVGERLAEVLPEHCLAQLAQATVTASRSDSAAA